jgi:tRNA U38,U39,U40 pseudouridine synthase TruA
MFTNLWIFNCYRNPGVRTIEEDLTNALFKARAISEDASRNYGKVLHAEPLLFYAI